MKTLSRYLLREVGAIFVLSLGILIGLLLTIRMLKFTALVVNKGVSLTQIATVFISIIPTFLEIAIPLAALLAVMMAFGRLSGDSEIVVMRTSGISLYQLLKPVAIFGVCCLVLGFFISHYLKPLGYRALSKAFFDIARTKSTAGLDQGIFNEMGKITFYAKSIDHKSGAIKSVLIDDRRGNNTKKIVTATSGSIIADSDSRQITFSLKDGQIHELIDDSYTITNYRTTVIALKVEDLFPGAGSSDFDKPKELYNFELNKHLNQLKTEKDSPALRKEISKIQIEKQRRIAFPFAGLIFALLAMPLGIQPPRTQRTWGLGISLIIASVIFLAYFALFSTAITMAKFQLINPIIAVWTPNFIFAIISFYTLSVMASEKWQHLFDVVESISRFFETKLAALAR